MVRLATFEPFDPLVQFERALQTFQSSHDFLVASLGIRLDLLIASLGNLIRSIHSGS